MLQIRMNVMTAQESVEMALAGMWSEGLSVSVVRDLNQGPTARAKVFFFCLILSQDYDNL